MAVETSAPCYQLLSRNRTDSSGGQNDQRLYLFPQHGRGLSHSRVDTFERPPDSPEDARQSRGQSADCELKDTACYELRIARREFNISPIEIDNSHNTYEIFASLGLYDVARNMLFVRSDFVSVGI